MIRMVNYKYMDALRQLYKPIEKEIEMLEDELLRISKSFGTGLGFDMFTHPFRVRGKRLRPALLMLSAMAASADTRKIDTKKMITLAAALELIHTASLVHDDVIDEDNERRGQKTVNCLYGNKTAVLTGDAFNARAFQMISSLGDNTLLMSALELIEKMSVGEILQLENNITADKDRYLKVITAKTALFIGLSCKFGALIAGAPADIVSRMENFGLNVGMAYQIIDDLIDKDQNACIFFGFDDAASYVDKGIRQLEAIKDSQSRQSMLLLIRLLLEHPDINRVVMKNE